ncbi:hypothetical protein [Vitiosangium sp. GDMCC 1.1324]|uniref:hypothetical protein n=1 Tax=Vitiosangium sp. (strain GDMCC 1.1324) TaxID=2138576 RepID=UPI000D39D767|nr:hypothetical protein [Vitiosangium sp. GDMCC 1.1324]PTL82118.1 hypothetical protein DAT35_20165 [Vitiosangium sp. GDMCC 1.1324]
MNVSALRPLLLLCVLLPGLALAQLRCPVPDGASASVGELEPSQRLAFIQSHLHEDARAARIWTGAWGAGYSLLTVGQLALAPAFAPEEQVDFYVGAISSAGGVAALLAVPLSVMEDSPTLDAMVARQPGPVDCTLLAEAERLLVRSARSEEEGRSWVMQTANVVYNVVTGLVLGLFFDRWASAAVTAATGWLLGEVMILTQPTGAQDALRLYREGKALSGAGLAALDWHVGVAMAPNHVGLQFRLTF